MRPPFRLSSTSKAAALVALLLCSFTACQNPKPAPPSPPPVKYSKNYDPEIKEIMELADRGNWEEAQTKATTLHEMAPKSPLVERVYNWVVQTGQQRREQALENEIRQIDAKNSVFNPTVKSLLKENKDRGLQAHKDIRDVVDRIENSPWIPDTYGKTLHEKGPLFDFESAKGHMVKVLEKEVTIHLDNVPLETMLINLSQTAGVNIVADKSLPALKQVLTANMDKVKLGEFLRYVGRNYDLQFQVGDELIWVVDAKDPKRLMEETRFYRLRKGFVLPAEFGSKQISRTETKGPNNVTTGVTEVKQMNNFVNDLAPILPALERAITNLFTGSKYMIDYERNLVVARGTPEQLDVMENIIKEFDRPIQQVLIEARFVTSPNPLSCNWAFFGRPATPSAPACPRITRAEGSGGGPAERRELPSDHNLFGERRPRRRPGHPEPIHQYSLRLRFERHHQRSGAKRGKPDPERPAPDRPQQPARFHQRRPGSGTTTSNTPRRPRWGNTTPPRPGSPAARPPRSPPGPS